MPKHAVMVSISLYIKNLPYYGGIRQDGRGELFSTISAVAVAKAPKLALLEKPVSLGGLSHTDLGLLRVTLSVTQPKDRYGGGTCVASFSNEFVLCIF